MASLRQVATPVLGAVGFFLGVQLGALALVEPFQAAGYQAVENPQDPANSALYIGVILVATAGMLLLFRYEKTRLLRAFLVATSGLITAYVFSVLFPGQPTLGPLPVHVGTVVGAGLVVIGLYVYPEWWVIDAAGLVMGMGAVALFGISFGILPALILLSALAVYDAISVYGTEHMLSLASGVMELRVPVIVIIPTTLDYSFIDMAGEMADDMSSNDENEDTESSSGPLERDAFFIGLGDAVIPSILVASAVTFLETTAIFGIELPALGAMIGTILGLLVLLRMVMKGRPHAGLPLLNGGAIGGYLIGALAAGVPLLQALGLSGYL